MKPTLHSFLTALGSKITSFKNLSCLVVVLLLSGGAWGQVSVTGASTGNGSYTTLGAAFTALGTTATGTISISITGNTTEAVGGISLGAGPWTSITIAPSGGPWTVSGAATAGTPLITFNGADNVTINGGGNLTFSNTTVSSTTGTSTLKLVADATNNTFNNVIILGSATGATGTNCANVWISTGTTTGNDGNSFQSCKFGPAGTNLPGQLIVANGSTTTTAIENSGITINNCEFFDYFQAATASAAIYMATGNTAWTVTNNKIYQTATRTITTAQTDYGIYMVNAGATALGEGYTITGNTIGYNNNAATGTLTYTAAATAGGFVGINFSGSASSTSTNNINSNIVSNIQWTSTGASLFTGIATNGNINTTTGAVINMNNNTISNIAQITSTGDLIAIYAGYAPTTNISGNTINNLSRTGATGVLYGVRYTGGTTTSITLNLNTISSLSYNVSAGTANFYGIYSGSSNAIENFTNNTINGMTSQATGAQNVFGIYNNTAATGNKTFQGNTISNLNLPTASAGTLMGIRIGFAGTANIISGNKINTFTGGTAIYGIYYGAAGTTTNIYNNIVYGLSSSVASPSVYGITATAGTTNNIYNNIIGNLTAPSATFGISVIGIYLSGGTTDNLYYNTVYLSGTSSGSGFGSAAIYASTTPTIDLRNNIFCNASTATGTGLAVAYYRSSTTLTTYSSTSNNNLFYGTSLFYDGSNNYTTLSAFKTAMSTRDQVSVSANLSFQSTTGSSSNFLKYDTTTSTVVESGGANISGLTDDYNGTIRFGNTSYVACSPTAGTAPDIGAWELCGIPLPACTAPSAQPTTLVLTPATTTATVSFTAASGTPDGYLVIRTTSSTAPTNPSNGSNYSGSSLGGTVISTSSSVSISDSGLTASTPYWYWVFPYNGGSTCAGPVYYTGGTILTGTTTTCGLAPVASAATNLGYNSFSANWGTSVGATTYLLDVATDSGFNSMVSGYNALDVGNVQIYSVTGLSAGNTYYYRVRASNGSCISSNSTSQTATTTAITSLTSGNWNATGTWSSNTIPTCGDIITIAASHNVTVNSATNVSKNLTIASGGTLTIASGDLTVGCTLNNTPLTNNGTLTVTGGTLNVNGNITSASGSIFNQSGGNINIDGNAAGNATNSVASGTALLQFNQLNTGINLTGGTLTIVDPHASSTSTLAIGYNNTTTGSQTSTANHTLRLGDGISTDAGGNVNGFRLDPWTGSAYLSFGNIIINGGSGTNRFVTIAQSLAALGDVTVTTGSTLNLNSTSSLIASRNVIVNSSGTFINTSGIISGLVASNTNNTLTFGPSTFAQTIGGSGTYQNLVTSPTANITSLTVNNTNATGVTISTPLSISGTLTMTAGKINTTATNLLTLGTSTAAGTLAYTAGQIAGPFARTFPASRTATGTYSVATLYPVGDGTTYLPIHIDPTTSAGGAIVLRGQAFNTNTGSGGVGVATTLSTNRWEALAISGSSNLTNCFVGLNDATIASGRIIAQSASESGTYNAIAPISTFATGTPNTLRTATSIAAASYSGYFTHAAPGPAITSFTPASVCPNAATTITITGTNLGSATSVTLNGEACTINTLTNTATSLTFTTDATPQSGNIVVTTAANSATSSTALALFTLPTVTASSNAVNNTICSASNITLNGGGASSYTWNNSVTNNTAFSPSASTTYTVTGTDGNGCTNTASIAVTVNNAVAISTQPSNQIVLPNDNGTFSLTASGTGLSYQWQENTGSTWSDISDGGIYSGATTSSLTLTGVSTQTSYQYRCVVSGTSPCNPLTSNAASLTISSTAVAAHPQNQLICSSAGTASFSITTTGTTPTYQWQVSVNSGSSWSDISGETTSTLSLSGLTTTNNGELYRCVLNGGVINSNSALLTVSPISIAGTVSADQGICANTSPANITLTGNTGTIQWQVSSDNSTFSNILNATSTTLTSTVIGTLSATRYYRALVTSGACSSSTSGVVTVTVTPTPNAGTLSGTQNACINGTTTFTSNGNSNGTWSSSNAGVATVNASSGVVSSVSVGTATITYTITGTGGCSTVTATRGVTVNSVPSGVTLTPSSATICNGSSQIIVASGGINNPIYFSEDFNSGLSAWTITNSGTSPSVSNWVSQSAPLTDASGSATFSNFSTTNGGMFAYANPDAGGSGTTTNTVLQSPSFNTLGAASATLTFEHVYRKYSADQTVTLEISIDNGATWTVLKDYKTLGSQGTTTSNAQATTNESITLANTYLNQSSVKIRFNYVSAWGYFWLIDNIKVSEIISNTMSWSPSTDLYTDAAATIAYTGNPRTVYAKPTTTTTYTATATSAAGCTSSNSVTVTVNPKPTALVLTGSLACAGSNGSITSSTSETGVNYQLYDSSNATVGTSVSGTGSALSWSSIAIGNGYYAKATNATTNCVSTNSNAVNVATISDKTWLGTTSNSWNNASNWSCGTLPSSSDVIVISSGSPVLDTNFTVGAAGSLTLSGTGTLTISPTSTLTITGTANFGGKAVTIKSNATGNGAIGQVTGTNLTGATNVTVERYIPAKRSWRAITAPVIASTIYDNWQEGGTANNTNGFEIWNPAGGTGITTGGVSSSLLSYSSSDNTWSGVTNTQAANTMMDGTKNKPFMAFITGPYGSGNVTSGATATTIRATGTLLTGDQSYPTVAGKYTFIGNPYASTLDLTAVLNTASNATTSFGGNVWVWDANVLGTYSVGTYNLFDFAALNYSNTSNNTNISGAQIQSGQAFFVKSTDGASFTIKESHKGSVFTNAVFRSGAPEILRANLYKQVNNEWAGRDGAMEVILSNSESNQDANKMANSSENIAFVKNGSLYASEHHLPLVASDVLNIRVWKTTAGSNYKLKINTEQFATTNLEATLEDLFTNSRTPLNLDGTAVEYPFTVTTEALSTGDRFRIVFQSSLLGTTLPTASGFSIIPNPVTGDSFQVNLGTLATGTYSYSIYNAIGQEVEKGSINNAAQNTNNTVKFRESAATGIYIMKIKGSDNSVFTAKIIKK